MKKVLAALGIASILTVPAFAEDWHYLGTFSAPANYDYVHDPLILDHLMAHGGFYENRRYFHVYYSHSHLSDEGESNEYLTWAKFNIQGKVIPLDPKTMQEVNRGGIYNAYVISNVNVSNKGTFSVLPQSLSAYDSATDEALYEASGNMGIESLWADAAATYILNLSGPHPVYKGALFGIAFDARHSNRTW